MFNSFDWIFIFSLSESSVSIILETKFDFKLAGPEFQPAGAQVLVIKAAIFALSWIC